MICGLGNAGDLVKKFNFLQIFHILGLQLVYRCIYSFLCGTVIVGNLYGYLAKSCVDLRSRAVVYLVCSCVVGRVFRDFMLL